MVIEGLSRSTLGWYVGGMVEGTSYEELRGLSDDRAFRAIVRCTSFGQEKRDRRKTHYVIEEVKEKTLWGGWRRLDRRYVVTCLSAFSPGSVLEPSKDTWGLEVVVPMDITSNSK